MIGVYANTLAVLFGSLIGILVGKKFHEEAKDASLQFIFLAVLAVGIKSALDGEMLKIIISGIIGTFIGTVLDLESKLDHLGIFFEKTAKRFLKDFDDERFVKGFVSCSILYCVGSVGILGALNSGIAKDYELLFIKSVLDGISSLIFASALGIGVSFSAVSILIYHGALVLLAKSLSPVLTPEVMANISGLGGIMIIALSLKMMQIKDYKVSNMLPSLVVVVIMDILAKVF